MQQFYIETYGCQMNEADSEYMASVLHSLGYAKADEIADADLVLVNTCSIREKAAARVLGFLGRVRPYKQKKRNMLLGVCGCVARQEGQGLMDKAPHVDLIFGPHHISRLPEFIDRLRAGGGKVVEVTDRPGFDRATDVATPAGIRALVPIMQGCNNFCSFCIVPHVRGREVSRPPADILAEIGRLAGAGIREVMLLGQNVNSYGNDLGRKNAFLSLVDETAAIGGIERIRFTTSHPKDLTDELIDAFGGIAKLCPQIHLPVQSGSDRILKLMNRKYDRAAYLGKVARLRHMCSDIAITTDVIVGFPGESDADFEATMELYRTVGYDGAFSFKFSPRPGTAAAAMNDQIPPAVKQERLERLQELQKEITYRKNRALEGTTQPVLVEDRSRRNDAEFAGRTPCFRIVNFTAPAGSGPVSGETVSVRIERGFKNSLRGVMADR